MQKICFQCVLCEMQTSYISPSFCIAPILYYDKIKKQYLTDLKPPKDLEKLLAPKIRRNSYFDDL